MTHDHATTLTAGAVLTPAQVLLAAHGTVYPPAGGAAGPVGPAERVVVEAGVALLEADLAERGYLLAAPLRAAFAALAPDTFRAAGLELLADLDAALGADRDHTPMFRGFPHATPADTLDLLATRIVAALLQDERQPCVLCGAAGTVQALSPCSHLVCTRCFAPADHAACPICYRRLAADDPYLAVEPARVPGRGVIVPARLRVLGLGADLDVDAATLLATLLARPTSLSGTDAAHADALIAARVAAAGTGADVRSWVPAQVPGRATKARLLGALVADAFARPADEAGQDLRAAVLELLAGLCDTATDVLRVAVVVSGGPAELTEAFRFTSLPRPVRRALLGVLEDLCGTGSGQESVMADMVRHRGLWKRLGQVLHPYEVAARFPAAAACFAVVRHTRLEESGGLAATVAVRTSAAAVAGGRVRFTSFAARVEELLAAPDGVADAVELLASRPGDLGRRADHLLRLAAGDPDLTGKVLAALEAAAPQMSAAVLVAALGAVRTHGHLGTRLFFPKGGAARGHVVADTRPALEPGTQAAACALLEAELGRRAAAGPAVEVAVLDSALLDVPAPFAARTASAALVPVPRASVLPLPAGSKMRLFVHWTEADERVDLDLSAAMFDADWAHVGTCDYTSLRFARAATHSGDYTSAPAPAGAAEFIDVDFDELARAGVRYLVAGVYSYNSVAFGDMAEAFAGVMMLPEDYDLEELAGIAGEREWGVHTGRRRVNTFDARAVEQRFDLTGRHKLAVPLLVDVEARTWTWLDAAAGVSGEVHAVWNSEDTLAVTGKAYVALTSARARVSLGELGLAAAAARADRVLLRHPDGSVVPVERAAGEQVSAFAGRLTALAAAGGTAAPTGSELEADLEAGAGSGVGSGVADAGPVGLAYLLTGDVPVAEGGEVFALYPRALDPARVRLLTAADVLAHLDPASTPVP